GIWVAGDLVGYNPWPNEVLQILRDRRMKAIRGNHERAALGAETFRFNELAAAAIRWTRIQLTPGNVGYLKDLEDRTRTTMPEGVVAMYHGSPRDDDEYVFPWTADGPSHGTRGPPLHRRLMGGECAEIPDRPSALLDPARSEQGEESDGEDAEKEREIHPRRRCAPVHVSRIPSDGDELEGGERS